MKEVSGNWKVNFETIFIGSNHHCGVKLNIISRVLLHFLIYIKM